MSDESEVGRSIANREGLFHSDYLLYPERQPEVGGTRQGPAQEGSPTPESVSAGEPPPVIPEGKPWYHAKDGWVWGIDAPNSDPGDSPPGQSPAVVPPQEPSSPLTAPASAAPASPSETANRMSHDEYAAACSAAYDEELAKSAEARLHSQIEPANQVLSLIDKALNLKANPETLERLLALQERIWAREAEIAFNSAKGRILKKLAGIRIVKSKSVLYENEKGKPAKGLYEAFKYAPLEEIDRVLSPLLAQEEMDLSYSDEPMADGRVMIRGRLKHLRHGHYEDSLMAAPLDITGGKNNVQAVGSTNSYLRRYVACNIFNLVVVGDDDDGKGAEPMLPKQVEELLVLIEKARVGSSFLNYMRWPYTGAQKWAEIVSAAPRSDYRKAKVTLEEHIAKQEASA